VKDLRLFPFLLLHTLTTQYFEEALLESQLTVGMRVRLFWQVALWRVLADFDALLRYLRTQPCETVRAQQLQFDRDWTLDSAYANRRNNLQSCENFLRFVLSGLGGNDRMRGLTNTVSAEHLQRYHGECPSRFNRRNCRTFVQYSHPTLG